MSSGRHLICKREIYHASLLLAAASQSAQLIHLQLLFSSEEDPQPALQTQGSPYCSEGVRVRVRLIQTNRADFIWHAEVLVHERQHRLDHPKLLSSQVYHIRRIIALHDCSLLAHLIRSWSMSIAYDVPASLGIVDPFPPPFVHPGPILPNLVIRSS